MAMSQPSIEPAINPAVDPIYQSESQAGATPLSGADLVSNSDPTLSWRSGAVLASVSLVFAAAAMRLIPHPPNFTPIAGMALFGAATLKRRELGLLMPLAALFLSDCFLGFHNQIFSVYISFMLISFLGLVTLRKNRAPIWLVGASLSSSVLFFVITNSAVVFSGQFYPHTFSGLMLSWAEGLPFLGNTVCGDLLSTGALFGLWAIVERMLPIKADSKARSVRFVGA